MDSLIIMSRISASVLAKADRGSKAKASVKMSFFMSFSVIERSLPISLFSHRGIEVPMHAIQRIQETNSFYKVRGLPLQDNLS